MHPHLQKAIAALVPAVFCRGLMAHSPDTSAPATGSAWVAKARGISEAVPPKMARAASEKTGWQIRGAMSLRQPVR